MSDTAAPTAEGAAAPFSAGTVVALVTIAIAAFAAFLLLSAYTPEHDDTHESANNALSVSAVGFAALVDLLRAQEIPVAVSRTAKVGSKPATLVLTPPPYSAAEVRSRLADARTTLLIVLPKWITVPAPNHPAWVEGQRLLDAGTAAAVLPAPAGLLRRSGREKAVLHGSSGFLPGAEGLQLASIDRLQTIGVTADWTPQLTDETGRVVLARWARIDRPAVLVLTDPDLLDTQGLKDLASARTAVTVLDALRGEEPLTFDVTLNGLGRSRNLLQLLFEPPLLGGTICAVGAGLMIFTMALHRFGPATRPVRVLDFGKRALADNSAGLIALAGRETSMAAPYGQLMRTLAAAELSRTRGGGAPTDAALDSAAAARGLADTYTGLAKAVDDVIDRSTLVDVARRLNRWSQGMRRERR